MTSIARRVAFQVLCDVLKSGAFANLALQKTLRKQPMYGDDKALCTHIVYGTLQRLLSLDAVLRPVCSRALSDLDYRVLTILRMTVYQLCFLNRVPAYAAINESVELCKASAPKAAGFVNGVLRSLVRDGRPVKDRLAMVAETAGSWEERQSLLHSFPVWMVRAWRDGFGESRTVAMLEACNEPAPLSVRVNRNRADRTSILQAIEAEFGEGMAEVSPVSPDGIRLRVGFDVEEWGAYQSGLVSVQDEAAMLVAPLLGVRPTDRVLDMCAAPGTKTTHIAELQSDQGRILATDLHTHKVRLIRQSASRLHLQSIDVRSADATQMGDDDAFRDAFDAVLLDAPCSGLGVLRHRPDIRWKRTEADIESLRALQQRLLASAMRMVKPGGVLVYSTCTLHRAENEDQIQHALRQAEAVWRMDDLSGLLPPDVYQACAGSGGDVTLTPELFGTDGFYMARLRREP